MQESLHDDLAGERSGKRRVLARGEQRDGKDGAGAGKTKHGRQQAEGILDLRHLGVSAAMENGGGDDQDGGIDEQGQREGEGGIKVGEADRLALAVEGARIVAHLHDRRVEIKIVRHDGRTQDADRYEEHRGIADDGRRRYDEVLEDGKPFRMGEEDLHSEEHGDGADEDDNQRLKIAEALALQQQDREDVHAGQEYAEGERKMEEQLQCDGRADDLGQVAGDDGNLREKPQGEAYRAAVLFAAGLGQVALTGDAQLNGETLQQDGKQIRRHDNEEQGVAIAGAAGEIGGPVAGIHVADSDKKARTEKAQRATPHVGRIRDADRRVSVGVRGRGSERGFFRGRRHTA